MEAQRLRLLCLGRLPYSPDEPLHFELWQLVCLGFTGQGAIEDHPAEALSSVPAWRALGCSAANPAHSLGDCGVLPLLHLLLALDYTSQLAARLLGAALGSPWAAPRAAPRPPPFSLVEVAAAATRWTLRLAAGGGLSSEARRLGSLTIAAGGACAAGAAALAGAHLAGPERPIPCLTRLICPPLPQSCSGWAPWLASWMAGRRRQRAMSRSGGRSTRSACSWRSWCRRSS